MTLNVTVLTPRIIYQSADFRLTDFDTGELITDGSPKTVSFTYSEWNGFITYTGVGRWHHRDVSDLITEWLTGEEAPTMAQVANIVADKGTQLLREYEEAYQRRSRHTFTLAGFEQHQPNVYVISNFEDCFGNSRNVIDDHLSVTHRPLGKARKALVTVTGQKRTVPNSERRRLASVAAKYPGDGLRIRRRLAQLNAAAAPESNGTVSADCVVLSFGADGTGAMQLDPNAVEVPPQFPHIMYGTDLNKTLTEALRGIGIDASRMVQIGYRSVQPGQPSMLRPGSCNYAIVKPDPSVGYELSEITSSDFVLGGARGISDRGQIIGTGQAALDQQPQIPWSYFNGHIERLPFLGLAAGVNNTGQLAAMLQGVNAPSPSWQRLYFYDGENLDELPLYDGIPGPLERSDSQGSAINSASVIAGSVAVQRTRSDRLTKLAAIFRPGQHTVTFDGVMTEHGSRALDINEQGHVLVMVSTAVSAVRSVLWDPANRSWHYVGDDSVNVFPTALTDDDVVLGQARNAHNQPVAMICRPGSSWERLGTPDNWIPIAMNNDGVVIGWTSVDQLTRPWIHYPNDETKLLPYLTDHHTSPMAINSVGDIVGSASADNDVHALWWRRGAN